MKKLVGASVGLAMASSLAVAAGGDPGGVGSAVSDGIRLVSAGVSDVSSGVAFDARWQTSAVSNPDPVNRAFGAVIVIR